jgi:hypothetical protein
MRWTGHVACLRESFGLKAETDHSKDLSVDEMIILKRVLKKQWEGMNKINLAQAVVNTVMNPRVPYKSGDLLTPWSQTISLLMTHLSYFRPANVRQNFV